jgi:hypothetical protein
MLNYKAKYQLDIALRAPAQAAAVPDQAAHSEPHARSPS